MVGMWLNLLWTIIRIYSCTISIFHIDILMLFLQLPFIFYFCYAINLRLSTLIDRLRFYIILCEFPIFSSPLTLYCSGPILIITIIWTYTHIRWFIWTLSIIILLLWCILRVYILCFSPSRIWSKRQILFEIHHLRI